MVWAVLSTAPETYKASVRRVGYLSDFHYTVATSSVGTRARTGMITINSTFMREAMSAPGHDASRAVRLDFGMYTTVYRTLCTQYASLILPAFDLYSSALTYRPVNGMYTTRRGPCTVTATPYGRVPHVACMPGPL